MQYRKYMYVEKLGTSDTEGLLNGTCYLSYKLDGTNAVVWLKEDGTLGFGSRRRELIVGEDNAGFMQLMLSKDYVDEYNDLFTYLTKYPTRIIYGEWLVRHTLRTYKEDAWKSLYVFDIYDTMTEKYINYDDYSKELEANFKHINYVPIIIKLINPTEEELKSYLEKTGDYLVTEGLGEGLVIKNYDFVNRFGRTVWAKVLNEDFKQIKNKPKQAQIITASEMEKEIIKFMTNEHVLKEKAKIEEHYGSWSSKNIFELLNRVFLEFWRDNWEIILKKFRNPIINFATLKKLSDERVKEVLKL